MGRRSRRRQRLINLRESATAVLEDPASAHAADGAVALHETQTQVRGEAVGSAGSLQLIQLIDAGWGSSGYYRPEVLKEAARNKIFRAGTHLYINHPTATEKVERPERSLQDLAAVMTEDARYDPQRQALVAQARVFSRYREFLTESHESIGLSIRADGVGEYGEAEGRRGLIVSELTRGMSVDYVTHAGRGGKVLALLESARSAPLYEARTVGAWLESRLHLNLTQLADDLYGEGRITREERITLSGAIGDGLAAWTARVEADAPDLFQRGPWDEPEATAMAEAVLAETRADETRRALDVAVSAAYSGEDTRYSWVRDFDPDLLLVWFDACDAEGDHTWQQAYTVTDDVIALADDRIQVVARTEYEPVGPGGDAEVDTADTAADETAEVAESAAPENVTDGAPPAAPAPPTTSEGSETVTTTVSTTGPAPGAAGTATATEISTSSAATAVHVVAESAAPTIDPAILERLNVVEAALTAERARGDQALAEASQLRAEGTARDTSARLLAEANIGAEVRDLIGTRVTERVLLSVPMTEAGQVDQAALETRVTEAITAERAHAARLLEAQGVGTVRGLGDTGQADTPQAKNLDRVAAFRRLGLSEAAAATAAAGQIGGRA